MLTSFAVENFRLFHRLEIARLGRVNLVVGKNNSGKSALLEAVELYTGNASLMTLRSLVLGCEETWSERIRAKVQQPFYRSVRHLFRGHQLSKVGEPGIAVDGGEGEAQRVQLKVVAYKTQTDESGNIQRTLLTAQEAADAEYPIEITIVVQDGDRVRRIINIDRGSDAHWTGIHILPEVQPKYICQSVPTHNMTSEKIAALWDAIGLTDAEDKVIAGLKLIVPTITGVAFVGSDSAPGEARVALVRTTDSPEPFPLKSMGDGMTRLFHIVVALVNAKDGILLIDEFENGLHWSVQTAIWKTVFRLAKDLNVQVFATTHSRDGVASFEEAWKDSPEDGAFIRLEVSSNGNSVAEMYTLETLESSLETDVEVR